MVAISLCLFACLPALKQVSVEASYTDFALPLVVSKEAKVAVDGSLTVTLCCNPETRFQWTETAQISDQTVLQQTDHKFVPPETTAAPPLGKEVWTFKALKAGKSTIFMECSRAWEGREEWAWAFDLTVVVK